MPKITPHLWFEREAVEAAEFYSSTLSDSKVINVSSSPCRSNLQHDEAS